MSSMFDGESSRAELFCSACQKGPFKSTGYTRHLQLSANPACRQLLEQYMAYPLSETEEPMHSQPSPSPSSQNPQGALTPWQGDYFGNNYDPDDDMAIDDVGPPLDLDRQEDEDTGSFVVNGSDDSDDDSDDESLHSWEPERPVSGVDNDPIPPLPKDVTPPPPPPITDGPRLTEIDGGRGQAEERLDDTPFITRYSDKYPTCRAGQPIAPGTPADQSYSANLADNANMHAPFTSKLDCDIAHWAKLRGPSSTALGDLLAIDGVREALGLSFRNPQELNEIIDTKLPSPRPKFIRKELVFQGAVYDLYSRDIVECIEALWSDPDFQAHLIVEPERAYVDQDRTIRAYYDMHTGKWWWDKQKEVDVMLKKPGTTLIPVIISTDQTQLTMFRNKNAYPVYLTIGNLPKEIRRKPSRQGQILLGYLPTSKLDHITCDAVRRRVVANIFHACMGYLTKPLRKVGITGIKMTSGDGRVRRTHPIFAFHIGDYPEQLLVTGTKKGQCPICLIPACDIGEDMEQHEYRDFAKVLEAFDALSAGAGSTAFRKACKEAGIKPIQNPYWLHLPFVDIFRSISPDILHQLYQGIVKHLIGWLKKVCGSAEIDARCRRLPPNHNIRIFVNGISHLQRVSGTEHSQILSFILGLIIDIPLPNGNRTASARLLSATRAILDYVFLAQYPIHTGETLVLMDNALETFHKSKSVFIDLGVRSDFLIPKLHSMNHHTDFITQFGTMDNCNTEYTERLHIDLAKDAYRSTNKKDEYPQMTLWLERREKILFHRRYLQRRAQTTPSIPPKEPPPRLLYPRTLQMAKFPSVNGVSVRSIEQDYGATHLLPAIRRFVMQYQEPNKPWTRLSLEKAAANVPITFRKLSVYHRIKFREADRYCVALDHTGQRPSSVVDSIHVEPGKTTKKGKESRARFDTALIAIDDDPPDVGIDGKRIGQVRCVFKFSKTSLRLWFDGLDVPLPPHHLAYVEWFTPFNRRVDPNHKMLKVSRTMVDGERQASIIPVDNICRSIHLIPHYGRRVPDEWSSDNVLDKCKDFFVNTASDRHCYASIYVK